MVDRILQDPENAPSGRELDKLLHRKVVDALEEQAPPYSTDYEVATKYLGVECSTWSVQEEERAASEDYRFRALIAFRDRMYEATGPTPALAACRAVLRGVADSESER